MYRTTRFEAWKSLGKKSPQVSGNARSMTVSRFLRNAGGSLVLSDRPRFDERFVDKAFNDKALCSSCTCQDFRSWSYGSPIVTSVAGTNMKRR